MILPSLRATALLLGLCCVIYPGVVTVLAQLAFPAAANASLLRDANGQAIGSELIGQAFSSPRYVQGRPSAVGYDAGTSGGSNLGPGSQKLAQRRAADEARLLAANPRAERPVPGPLLAASGSGLDPHLSAEAARWQLPRIAEARGVELARVESLLVEHVEGHDATLLGEAQVNVLAFNIALDRRLPASP